MREKIYGGLLSRIFPFVSLSIGDVSSPPPLDDVSVGGGGGGRLLIKKLAWQYVNICVALFRRIIFAELSR